MVFVVSGVVELFVVESPFFALDVEPCNFLFTDFRLFCANVSAPETAKAFTIVVESGLKSLNAFRLSLVALSKLVFCNFEAVSLSCAI